MKRRLASCFFFLLNAVSVLFAQDQAQIRATTSAVVDGVKYKAICYGDKKILINNAKGETVLTLDDYEAAGFNDFTFIDFNGDGCKDLRVEYMTNVPGICDMVLYDKRRKKFVKVEGFDRYPDPLRLAGTMVYYSYHRSGCADSNWDSDLFVIKNFKPIKLGTISGRECADSGIKDGIYIYKLKSSKTILHKQLPIAAIEKYKDHKWGFIKDYWKQYYKEFVN